MSSGDGLHVSDISVVIGDVRILEEVSFEVRRGETMGIIGPNGAGKTTVLNVIGGVIRPISGTVRFGDETLTGRRPHRMRPLGIGRSLQSTQYFRELTCLELVALASAPNTVLTALAFRGHRRGNDTETRAALDLVGVGAYAHEPLGQVSTAVQKLVDLARAVAAGDALLLLDEPSSGVSESERTVISDALKRVRQTGRTILLIDHDPSFVLDNCDRLLAMNFGRVLKYGAPDTVMADDEVRRSYLGEGIIA